MLLAVNTFKMEQNHTQRNVPSEDQQGQYKYAGINHQHQSTPSTSEKNSVNEDKDTEMDDNYRDVIFRSQKKW